ncbi:MAG: metallophosphoesterase [Treponemataceae bacterium]
MKFSEFFNTFHRFLEQSPELPLDEKSRYVFLSDLHIGDGGSNDDLEPNRELVRTILGRWYLERGYTLILGGDIEDLQKFSMEDIQKAWFDLYGIFDEFAKRGAFFKLVGNHDLALLRKKSAYPLHHGLRLVRKSRTLFCFHGHQASPFFAKYGFLSELIVRYLAKPLQLKNSNISGDSRKRFKAERRIYRASKKLGIVSICGHTHRPLFESLSKYDDLRLSIELLLREYPQAPIERKQRIAELVGVYRSECERMNKKDMHWALSRSLYEEKALLIPCVFNSGCATGKHGITCLEIEAGNIRLAHWARQGKSRSYLAQEALRSDNLGGTDATRYTLREADLDGVFARIDLLGGEAK